MSGARSYQYQSIPEDNNSIEYVGTITSNPPTNNEDHLPHQNIMDGQVAAKYHPPPETHILYETHDRRRGRVGSTSKRARRGRGHRGRNNRNEEYYQSYDEYYGSTDLGLGSLYDPTVCYVKRGTIALPVEMTFHANDCNRGEEEFNNFSQNVESKEDQTGELSQTKPTQMEENQRDPIEPSAPTYSIQQSRLSIYTAFPPPPIILPPKDTRYDDSADTDSNTSEYDEEDLLEIKEKLEKFSGFHCAMGATSAMRHSEGYADSVLSFNYRVPQLLCLPALPVLPSLLSLPSMSSLASSNGLKTTQRIGSRELIGNMHCNLYLGSLSKMSLGGTASSLDGRTHLCLDVGNPFFQLKKLQRSRDSYRAKPTTKEGILSPSPQSDYTISATRDFFLISNPCRLYFTMRLAPMPPPVFLPTTSNGSLRSDSGLSYWNGVLLTPLKLQYFEAKLFSFSVTESTATNIQGKGSGIIGMGLSKCSLSLGYGNPPAGGEGLWMARSVPELPVPKGTHSNGLGSDLIFGNDSSFGSSDSGQSDCGFLSPARLKLSIDQQLSPSQSLLSSFESKNLGRNLSFGIMSLRSFANSSFSRLGVGVRCSFNNIFHNLLSSGKSNWWKGMTWWLFQLERGDVKLVVPVTFHPHALTSESLQRIFLASTLSILVDAIVGELFCEATSFLRHYFGNEQKRDCKPEAAFERDEALELEREKRWLWHQMAVAREEAFRQRKLMARQARASLNFEKEQAGLVIVKAIYGVMDDETRQWVLADCPSGDEVSRQNGSTTETVLHTLDVTTQLQFWVSNSSLSMPAVSKRHMLGFYDVLAFVSSDQRFVIETCFKKEASKSSGWLGSNWQRQQVEKERDLAVVLSIRYKFAGKMYEVMFYDEEAVDLPSVVAREVLSDQQ